MAVVRNIKSILDYIGLHDEKIAAPDTRAPGRPTLSDYHHSGKEA